MRSLLLSMLAMVMVTGTLAADDAPPLVTKVFNVADLVTPIPGFQATQPAYALPVKATAAENADELKKLIQNMVMPYSWDAAGGKGTTEFFDIGSALVVTNRPDAVAAVEDMLTALRRLQEVSVSTEVRIVTAPVGFCKARGLKRDGTAFLTARDVHALLNAAQSDARTNILMAPKITTFNGQTATLRCGETRDFVTGGEAAMVKGQPAFLLKSKSVDLGHSFTLCGQASANEKFVKMQMKVTHTEVVGEVKQIPVVTQITPIFEGGSIGKPVPFTQYLQMPNLKTHTLDKTVMVPTGGTFVLGGWNQTVDVQPSKNPYLNRLIKNNTRKEEREVIVLVTPRVIRTGTPVAVTAPPCAMESSPKADTLIALADVRLEAAFSDETVPGRRDELLDQARRSYQKVLEKEPKNKAGLIGMARYYTRIGEKATAVAVYKKYLTLYPTDVEAVQELALAHARWKDWAGAVTWCEFALKIDPENRAVKKTMGFCLARAGKWEEAFAVLCKVMPEAEARYNMACALCDRGLTEAGEVQLKLALKADPTFTPARDLLTKQADRSVREIVPAGGFDK